LINLIDADIIAYRAAASCEPTKVKPFLEAPETALYRLHDMMQRICVETNCSEVECYLGGTDNFRYKLYPEYKGNRTAPKPTYLNECRELLVIQYGATIVNNIEADDALGIAQTKYEGLSTICSIDKDLLQIPGKHYNFVKKEFTLVSPLDGLKTFYKQLIAGDGTDNIPSYDGKTRNSIPKFIQKLQEPLNSMTDAIAMYKYLQDVYQDSWQEKNMPGESISWEFDHKELHVNAQLLYILKEEEGFWQSPKGTE
jgi:5'-3' exonuclease